jgi:hypothetical protein
MRVMSAAAMIAFTASLLPGAASAENVDAAEPESVLAALRAYGHKAQLETDEAGLPALRARVGDINYSIQFYGCEGTSRCTQLQFAATFDLEPGLGPDFANQWNEDWAIGRLSVNVDGDPLFTYFLTTAGGGLSPANFAAVLDIWTGALLGVVSDIGY